MKQPRLLLYGLLAGLLLSALRAPEGLDWTQLGAVSGSTAAAFHVGALIAMALFLDGERRAFRRLEVWPLLLALAVGFAFHGLVLEALWRPAGRLGFGFLLILATVGLWRIAGPVQQDGPTAGQDGTPGRLALGERLAIVVSAAGATLALGNLPVDRPARAREDKTRHTDVRTRVQEVEASEDVDLGISQWFARAD